jgi:DNA-binding Xre family transcriptional regulator
LIIVNEVGGNLGKIVNRVPEFMRMYIEKERISQAELARRINADPSTITLILQGKRGKQVQLDILERLCLLLNVTPNDLLWEEDAD